MKIRNLLLGTALALSVLGCGGESSSTNGESGDSVKEGVNTTSYDFSNIENGFTITTNAGFGQYNGEEIIMVTHEIKRVGVSSYDHDHDDGDGYNRTDLISIKTKPGITTTSCVIDERTSKSVKYICTFENGISHEFYDEDDEYYNTTTTVEFYDGEEYHLVQTLNTQESAMVELKKIAVFPEL